LGVFRLAIDIKSAASVEVLVSDVVYWGYSVASYGTIVDKSIIFNNRHISSIQIYGTTQFSRIIFKLTIGNIDLVDVRGVYSCSIFSSKILEEAVLE
jgi:hypothetical protein